MSSAARVQTTTPIDRAAHNRVLGGVIPNNCSLALPDDYEQNIRESVDFPADYWTEERIRLSSAYQLHVYRWAAVLAKKHPSAAILDVGCGVGTKIEPILVANCDSVTGIDTAESIRKARQLGTPAEFIEVDLEVADFQLSRTYDVIVCADVIEHLVNPDPLLQLIHDASHDSTDIIISTPDRNRLRGRRCRDCTKPDHIREWTIVEFSRFLRSRRFRTLETRLFPQDDSIVHSHVWRELRFRSRLASRSPLACQAIHCNSEQLT